MSTTWDDPTVPMNEKMKTEMLHFIYRTLVNIDIDVDSVNPDLLIWNSIEAEQTKESIDRCIELVGYLLDSSNRGRYS